MHFIKVLLGLTKTAKSVAMASHVTGPLYRSLATLFCLLCEGKEEEVTMTSFRLAALRWTASAFLLFHLEAQTEETLQPAIQVLLPYAQQSVGGLIEMAVADADRLIVEQGGFDDARQKEEGLLKCTRQIIGNVTRLEKMIEV